MLYEPGNCIVISFTCVAHCSFQLYHQLFKQQVISYCNYHIHLYLAITFGKIEKPKLDIEEKKTRLSK